MKRVVSSFPQSKFEPQYYARNCHWQTIFGTGALCNKLFGQPPRPFITTEERIETYDGDFFDVEYTGNFEYSDKVAILLHGLESSSKGPLVTSFASAFLSKGFGCCLVSFRGCSGEDNRFASYYQFLNATFISLL